MTPVAYNFGALAPQVEAALRAEFPHDTIEVSEGYLGRIRVKLVSNRFNGMGERDKQDLIWEILRARLGADAQAVSYALAYGTDEL